MEKKGILRIVVAAALMIAVFGAAAARADVYMKQKVHTGEVKIMGQTQPEKDVISVFWLGENKARTDNEDGKSTILLGDKKVLYMLDHNKMQYAEMPMDLEKMIDEAMAGEAGDDPETAEAKKKMPAFMKNMMKGVMGSMSAKVTETGETKKVGNWNCRKYLIDMNMMGGEMKSEAWATEDIKVDAGFYFTAGNAMLAGQPGFDKIVKEMQKVKGVIVYQTGAMKMMGAEVVTTTEVLECTDKAAPAGTYDIPAGYKKVKGMGRG
jgi:hypothetical protein